MDILSALFQQHSRQLGSGKTIIVPSVVVSEVHKDIMTITAYPVEQGAIISDHAYLSPAKLTMELGFAGGGSLFNFYDTTKISQDLGLGLSPQDTYRQILDLQATRIPFDVTTGKRQYNNMLIDSITVTTDATKEYVLSCSLELTQVIITSTNSTGVKAAEKNNMAHGVSTSPVVNSGQKTPTTPGNPAVAAGTVAAR